MRVTCIALAAVALALVKQTDQAPERVSRNTYTTYALSADTRTSATSITASPARAIASAASGVIDFTPLPSPDEGTAVTALVAQNDTTRCVTVKDGGREPAVAVVGCSASPAQSFTIVGGEIRTPGALCVTAPDSRDNAVRPVSLEPCTGTESQQWTSTPTGELRGYRGKCLTAAAGLQRREGTPLAVRGCMGRSDQQWSQRRIAAGRTRVDSIRVNAVALSLGPGRSTKVNALAINPEGQELHDELVTWVSSDPSVAVVTPTGLVTAVGGGSTTIVAMAQGRVKSVAVEVRGTQYAGVESGTATFGAEQP